MGRTLRSPFSQREMLGALMSFGQPPRDDLTVRVFRVLYQRFDLRTVGGTYVVVPKGTPCFAGPSLGDIARQISDHERPDPAAPASGTPAQPG